MRFSVHSDILKEGVLSVIKALPVRSSMPVLEGVQLVAGDEGVLLRCCANFDGLDGSFYRTAVRTRDDNERLVKALERVM